jgi:hypothetical protein
LCISSRQICFLRSSSELELFSFAICEHYKAVQNSMQILIVALVWNMSEVVRYSNYAINLIGILFVALTWFRYIICYCFIPNWCGKWNSFMVLAINYVKDDHHCIITTSNQLNITFTFYCFIVSIVFCCIRELSWIY